MDVGDVDLARMFPFVAPWIVLLGKGSRYGFERLDTIIESARTTSPINRTSSRPVRSERRPQYTTVRHSVVKNMESR